MTNDDSASAKLARMMEAVQHLLAQADHPNTGEAEAEAFRSKAEALMAKFRISEEEVNSSSDMPLTVPVFRSFPAFVPDQDSTLDVAYRMILGYVLANCEVRGAIEYGSDPATGQLTAYAHCVGYESDLRYAEMVYTAARTYFASRISPKVNPDESDGANVYRLRSSGIERIRIARMMGWGETGSATAKVTRVYKAECERRGVPATMTGRDVSVKTFRESFCQTFPRELYSRLVRARNAAQREYSGGLPVLANRKGRVDEAFYQRYPHLRPADTQPTKKAKPRKVSVAAIERMERLYDSPAGRMGRVSGAEAARAVDLGRTDPARLSSDN